MRKKTLLKLSIVIGCISMAYHLYSQVETNVLNELVFQNTEALANGEDDEDADCFGYGTVDCRGYKVEMKITGLSLD